MSRKDSEEKFLQALKELLIEGQEPGINAVAERAGLNKVLIYRYFNGLDGLMEIFARKMNLWGNLRLEFQKELKENKWSDLEEAGRAVFNRYRKTLQMNPMYISIFKMEMYGHNPLTRKLEEDRETEGLRVLELVHNAFAKDVGGIDLAAISSLIISGITYLVLKSQDTPVFNGINLELEAGWQRIEQTWSNLIKK